MRGMRTGVKTQVLQEYLKATFSYCLGHNLNMVVKYASCAMSVLSKQRLLPSWIGCLNKLRRTVSAGMSSKVYSLINQSCTRTSITERPQASLIGIRVTSWKSWRCSKTSHASRVLRLLLMSSKSTR